MTDIPAGAEYAPLFPEDPDAALAMLQESHVALGIMVRLTVAEDESLRQVRASLAEADPYLEDRLGDHGRRAVVALYGLLKEVVGPHEPDLLLEPTRILPVAAKLWGTVDTLLDTVADPVLFALGQATWRQVVMRRRTGRAAAPQQRSLPPGPAAPIAAPPAAAVKPVPTPAEPAAKPAIIISQPKPPAAAEALTPLPPSHPLALHPNAVLFGIRYHLSEGAHLGNPRAADDSLIPLLRDELLRDGQLDPDAALGHAHQFVTVYSSFLRKTSDLERPLNVQIGHLMPHLRHYIAEVDKLRAMGIKNAYRRAWSHSPEQLATLYEHWVGQKGLSRADFYAQVHLSVNNLDGALADAHRKRQDRASATAVARPGAKANKARIGTQPLDTEPTILHGMRSAILHKEVTMRGSVVSSLTGTMSEITGQLIADGYQRADARNIARFFVKAVSRYSRMVTGQPHHDNLTTERLQPLLAQYLEDCEGLRQLNVPAPYRRGLTYDPATMAGLYDYWVGTKHLPEWAFDGVVASKALNIDKALAALYENYGEEVPPLKRLLPEGHISQPLAAGTTMTLEDLLHESAAGPEASFFAFQERIADVRHVSDLLRSVSLDQALAVVLVYDLDVRGGEDIDVAALATRLSVPVRGLAEYVEETVMPLLAQRASGQAV
ncbi:MAG TPA: hypothetical protein VF466_00925 [Candidatus Saccharimonadales bacterium]